MKLAMKLVELKARRETYGQDERAINKHSVRIFKASGKEGMEFYLNRTLDGCPPFYCLYFYKPASAMPTMMPVDGREYWGDGWTWTKAEARAFAAIRELMQRSR